MPAGRTEEPFPGTVGSGAWEEGTRRLGPGQGFPCSHWRHLSVFKRQSRLCRLASPPLSPPLFVRRGLIEREPLTGGLKAASEPRKGDFAFQRVHLVEFHITSGVTEQCDRHPPSRCGGCVSWGCLSGVEGWGRSLAGRQGSLGNSAPRACTVPGGALSTGPLLGGQRDRFGEQLV